MEPLYLNPVALASKLCKNITPRTINRYGLALVDADARGITVSGYHLNRWGHRHGLYDPLGAVHELIMEAIGDRDRTRLSALTRVLITRVGEVCGVVVPRVYGISAINNYSPTVFQRLMGAFRSRASVSNAAQTAVTLHIHHYLVRRLHNLVREWPSYDANRQVVIINLADLIIGLSKRSGTALPIRISLFAILHICLGFRKEANKGNYEPIVDLIQIARLLENAEQSENARILLAIALSLQRHTSFLTPVQLQASIGALPSILQTVLEDYVQKLDADPKHALWASDADPWHYLMDTYGLFKATAPAEQDNRPSIVTVSKYIRAPELNALRA